MIRLVIAMSSRSWAAASDWITGIALQRLDDVSGERASLRTQGKVRYLALHLPPGRLALWTRRARLSAAFPVLRGVTQRWFCGESAPAAVPLGRAWIATRSAVTRSSAPCPARIRRPEPNTARR